MFQFRRFPSYAYLIQRTIHRYCLCGFPHSDIRGSLLMCSSPRLFAACHVLRRLLMPRHSPCALCSLTCFGSRSNYASSLTEVRNCYCYPFISSEINFPQYFTLLLRAFSARPLLSCFTSLFSFQGAVSNALPSAH